MVSYSLRGSGAALAEEAGMRCSTLTRRGPVTGRSSTQLRRLSKREGSMASRLCHQQRDAHPQQVADKLNSMDFAATPDMIMTSAMDIGDHGEELEANKRSSLSAVPACVSSRGRGSSSWTVPAANPSRSCRVLTRSTGRFCLKALCH